MLNIILQYLSHLPKDYIVLIVSALPVSELRGAIPLALSFGMPLVKAFWLSVLGNCLFVAPALFLFVPVTNVLRKIKIWSRFFDWVFERSSKHLETIQKYEALGLFIFVAIPLPMTGAWSGVIVASLFKIRFHHAFPAIIAGVICAGMIVSTLCALGMLSWKMVAG